MTSRALVPTILASVLAFAPVAVASPTSARNPVAEAARAPTPPTTPPPTPRSVAATADAESYAARDRVASAQKAYKGGEGYVVIGGTTIAVILLVVLVVILL